MKSSGFVDYLLELLEPLPVTARSMFGGFGIYRSGIIFGIMVEDQLYLKVGPSNRADYEKAGSEPFTYEARGNKKVAMSYWLLPPELLDDREELFAWAQKAYDASLNAPKPAKKPKRRKA